MTAFEDINEGDTVEVIYRGKVELKNAGSVRINGLWHPGPNRTTSGSIEVIEPALQVGWHRVVAVGTSPGAVIARHWDGSQWGQSELTHSTVRSCYTSIQFLGGGPDE